MLAKTATFAGVALIGVGTALPYLDLSYQIFFFVIGCGILLTFVGSIAWFSRSDRSQCLRAAAVVFGVSGGAFLLGGSNGHVYGLFFFAALPGFLLSAILLVMGIFRGRRSLAKTSHLVRDGSMRVNAEFSAIEHDPRP